jgi:23S rRNA (pseudouridine1915-N3)-methyltransferase
MNIRFIAVGKNRNYLNEEVVVEYTSRLQHYSSCEWIFIPASDMQEEGIRILKAIPDQAYVVVLDEKGKSLSSLQLADFLQKRMNESTKNLVFIIGGAHGFADAVKEQAQFVWSLSNLTFPHELVRAILSEAVYRAYTIVKGEKYHHA